MATEPPTHVADAPFISVPELDELAEWAQRILTEASPLRLDAAVRRVLAGVVERLAADEAFLVLLGAAGQLDAVLHAPTPVGLGWSESAITELAALEWAGPKSAGHLQGYVGELAQLPLGPCREGLRAIGLHSVAVVPVLVQHQRRGVLLVGTRGPHRWPLTVRSALGAVATAISRVACVPQHSVAVSQAALTATASTPGVLVASYDVEAGTGVQLGSTVTALTGLRAEAWAADMHAFDAAVRPDDRGVLEVAYKTIQTRHRAHRLTPEIAPPVSTTIHLLDTTGAEHACELSFHVLSGTERPLVTVVGRLLPVGVAALTPDDVAHEASVLPSFVESANIVIALIDPRRNPRGLYVSAGYERWSGRSRESFLASDETIFAGVHEDDVEKVDTRALLISLLDEVAAGRVSSTEALVRQEIRRYDQKLGERVCALELFPVRHKGEWVAGVLVTDITEERVLIAERDEALAQAQAALAQQQRLLARVSHEMISPLNGILGWIQLVRANGVSAEQDLRLQRAQHAGTRLVELVGDVLELGKIRTGEVPELVPVHLGNAVEEVVTMFNPVATTAGVSLVVQLAGFEDAPWVAATPGRVFQVLANLVSNAIKFSPRHGTVEVRAWPESRPTSEGADPAAGVCIEVRDHGPGIPAELQAQLFQPFERLNADSRGVAGTGLGLVLARELAESLGGSLRLHPDVTDGASFRVWLAASAPGVAPGVDPAPVDVPITPEQSYAVLYLEDDPASREVLAEVLAADGRFTLSWADTLADGLVLAERGGWDLVVTDLHLPDAFGDEAVVALSACPALVETPIVVATADRRPEIVQRTLEAGAQVVWDKPLSFATLPQTLATLCASRRAGTSA